jgi:hypothetical protein
MSKHSSSPSACASSPQLDELLTELQSRGEAGPQLRLAQPWVCEVLESEHPSIAGRILARWMDPDGEPRERWIPVLMGLPIRTGDRILAAAVQSWPEPIAIGIVDGFRRREVERAIASVTLPPGHALRIVGAAGTPLLEVTEGREGPVVTLLHDDLALNVRGRLTLAAKSIDLHAREGKVEVKATDDVVVRGEVIHLN